MILELLAAEWERLATILDTVSSGDGWASVEPSVRSDVHERCLLLARLTPAACVRANHLMQVARARFPAARWIAQFERNLWCAADVAERCGKRAGDALQAIEMGDAFQDAGGRELRRVLSELGVSPTPEHIAALFYVLNRKPRRGPHRRWRRVIEDQDLDQVARTRGWLRKSVLGHAKRERNNRGNDNPRDAAHGVRIGSDELSFWLEYAQVTDREADVCRRHWVEGIPLSAIASDEGISPSTARNLLRNARRKLKRAGAPERLTSPRA